MHFQWGVTPMKKTNKNKQLFIFKCFIFFSLHLNIQHPILTRVVIFREKIMPRNTNRRLLFTPSEFCLFRGTENARNSVPRKMEMLGIPFRTISRKRKTLRSELFSERKNFWKLLPHHSRIKKPLGWLLENILFGILFRFVANLGTGYSEYTEFHKRSTFFHGIMKTAPSIQRNIFGTEFW